MGHDDSSFRKCEPELFVIRRSVTTAIVCCQDVDSMRRKAFARASHMC